MKRFLAATFAALLVAAPAAACPYQVRVTGVVDGDTFSFDTFNLGLFADLKFYVRVRGIDTPERGAHASCPAERAKAEEAALETRRLLNDSGNLVTLNNIGNDKYGGRVDADVILKDGTSLGDRLLAKGLAHPYDGEGKKISWCG